MDDERYKRAKARVEALKGFYGHLTTFIVVGAALFLINVLTFTNWWFYWPLLFWGIALAVHALSIFVLGDAFGPDWERRKIDELMRQDNQRRSP